MPFTEAGNERRTFVLSIALELFARRGIEGAGLREIARQADISEPTLYHHFRSKDALIDALIAELLFEDEHLHGGPFDVAKTSNVRDGLLAFIDYFQRTLGHADRHDLLRMVLAELARNSKYSAPLREGFIKPLLELLASLFTHLAKARIIGEVDADALAVAFLSPMLFVSATSERGSDLRRRLFAQHLEVFVRGLPDS